jgi:GxxExxY protein
MNDETARNGHETERIEAHGELLHRGITRVIIECFSSSTTSWVLVFWRMSILAHCCWSRSDEVSVPILYDGVQIARYKMDFIVDDLVVVEVKSSALVGQNDRRQLLNYLRCTRLEVGLLLHFGPSPKFYRMAAPSDDC